MSTATGLPRRADAAGCRERAAPTEPRVAVGPHRIRKREFSIVATTDVSTRDQFDNLIIANVKGYPVRLRDVADVQVGAVNERVIARYNGKPSINMGLIKQAVANPLDLSHALREELARINPTLPPGMSISISYDSSVFIDRSIKSVFRTVAEAVLLVALVIFFLRNLRATLIPLVTIPLALVGSFALMYAFGFTINTLTLLAMVLAIGLVVDDAIVVLENIYRNIEAGMDASSSSDQGHQGDRLRGVAMTLTLTAVMRRWHLRQAALGGSSSSLRWRWPARCWSRASSR